MGKLTAIHMKSQGVQPDHDRRAGRWRTPRGRPKRSAARRAAPWDELDAALGAADIVITATGAAAPILTKAHIEAVMRPRRNRPLFIIDIAMPRDVEPAAGEIEQVFLYNIDDLQATVRENLARRASEVARAEAIVGEEVEKFGAWLRSRGAIPTVVALRQRFEAIRRAELERLEFKLSALPPEARARVDEITRLIVEKLLLTPTEQLKALGDADTHRRVLRGAHAPVRRSPTTRQTAEAPARTATRSVRRRGRHRADRREEPRDPDVIDAARFGSARAAASSRCGRRTPSPAASPTPADRRARSSSSRRPAIGCRRRRSRRSAASGCS